MRVEVREHVAASPDAVWAIVRRFWGDWHPFIEWIKAELDDHGGLTRCFKVRGEDGLYRERLTYFSDYDRELRYTHIEGIRDAIHYAASLKVDAFENGCEVIWSAELEAPDPRATEIADGTKVVFEAGVAALTAVVARHKVFIDGEPRLCVTHSGTHEGPLVLFLHGIGGRGDNWNRQLDVAALSHQTAAMDFRGYGGSSLGPSQTRVEDHCADIIRVMDYFGKQKVVLCGMSFGSWIAGSFAMRHPEKLSGLIFSGGCTGMSEAGAEEREAFLSSRQKPLDAGQAPKDFSDQVVQVLSGPQASEATRKELKDSMAAIPADTYRDALWCFTHPEERFDFARISCPVLMMTGEFDRLATPAEIRSVAHRIHATTPNADVSFEVISGAGHLCNIEQPERFNQLLARFLERISI